MSILKLSEDQIRDKLKTLKGWSWEDDQIQKKYSFKDFKQSISFVTRVALIAEQADHHPDIDIRYNNVFLKLATHSAGGLTEKDFNLAREIDAES